MVDVGHRDALRLLRDRVNGLLLRADEEDRAAALGEVSRERSRLLEQLEGLLQVDDVDAAPLAEDEPLHLRVPAARLVAEVDSGFQKLSHADDCHGLSPFPLVWLLCCRRKRGGTGRRRHRHRHPADPPGRWRKTAASYQRGHEPSLELRLASVVADSSRVESVSAETSGPLAQLADEIRTVG